MKKMFELGAVILLVILTGCQTGSVKTTTWEYDIPTGKLSKITIIEDSRGTKQNKINTVGLDLALPDPTGITGMPALCRIKLGWINDDMQNTPIGMASTQTKDYEFIMGNKISTTQLSGSEEFVLNIFNKWYDKRELIKSAVENADKVQSAVNKNAP